MICEVVTKVTAIWYTKFDSVACDYQCSNGIPQQVNNGEEYGYEE